VKIVCQSKEILKIFAPIRVIRGQILIFGKIKCMASNSKTTTWIGYVLSALPALFLLLDGTMKLIKPAPVIEATVQLGYPESVIIGLGVVLLSCTILYLIPQTSVLGAILLTGYLGGAVATHVRVGDSLFSILFPVVFGILIWGGLYLRDERLRLLIPFHY
jgi:DoxX-like family